jgi:peptidoglycan/xylan/chitin deacetylase (PgdA/CDA1 family)
LYMRVDQITWLANAGLLGTHGHDHVPLGSLAAQSSEHHITRSVDLIRGWTGRSPVSLSYPYGSIEACCSSAAAAALACGITFAFTMERAQNALDDLMRNPLCLARFDCNDLPGGKAAQFTEASLFYEAPFRTWELARRN